MNEDKKLEFGDALWELCKSHKDNITPPQACVVMMIIIKYIVDNAAPAHVDKNSSSKI